MPFASLSSQKTPPVYKNSKKIVLSFRKMFRVEGSPGSQSWELRKQEVIPIMGIEKIRKRFEKIMSIFLSMISDICLVINRNVRQVYQAIKEGSRITPWP